MLAVPGARGGAAARRACRRAEIRPPRWELPGGEAARLRRWRGALKRGRVRAVPRALRRVPAAPPTAQQWVHQVTRPSCCRMHAGQQAGPAAVPCHSAADAQPRAASGACLKTGALAVRTGALLTRRAGCVARCARSGCPTCGVAALRRAATVVEGVAALPRERWGVACVAVRPDAAGVALRCNAGHCSLAFHALCARNAGLYLAVRGDPGKQQAYRAYCVQHSQMQRRKDAEGPGAGSEVRAPPRAPPTGVAPDCV